MKKNNKKNAFESGVTLIETIVGVALVSLIVLSLYTALFNVTRLFADSKQKTVAVALANEKMEIIRNLEYDDVGTQGWIPVGPLLQTENISKNGFIYTVDTLIEYIDDAYDGQGGDDTVETDYKQARIEVSWTANGQTKSVVHLSKFVPNGLESDVGGGVLSVNAVDDGGTAVPIVTVTVDSVDESPPIHGSTISDAEGNVRIAGMPQQEYKITITKSDYETVETYPNPPGSSFTPLDSNIMTIDESVVMKTLVMNKSADLTIEAVNIADDSGISGIDIDLLGGRIIGTDPDTFNFDQTETTDGSGKVELNDISPGSYDITNTVSLETTELKYIGADSEIPIVLVSEDDKEVKLLFAEKNIDSLLVWVKDSGTFDPIEGAEVQVTATGFDQTVTTGETGIVYFPAVEDPPVAMPSDTYQIDIQVTGYSNYSDTVSVSNLTEHEAMVSP
ncbi:MAG: carboxypeptidase-like regulatory domain-containing protein [Patescibacteria group bacterium]|nr:carboxypeptidase-like regulatory domain-containing protein [Patescibacteria group bacterium]